jgi:ABC-type transport system involved in cytochrome c biogenesis permease component
MLSWPVIQREMLVEARRPGNYRLRLVAGAAACLLLGLAAISESTRGTQSGYAIFMILHLSVLLTILVLGPLLTSDALSKETREGTLGLLFLTPLTARQIVGGKFLVHFVRLLTIWALGVPFLMVPLLVGGVSGQEIGASFLIQMCAAILSAAAGMLASSKSRNWVASLGLAQVISWSMSYLVCIMAGGVFVGWVLLVDRREWGFPLWDLFVFPVECASGYNQHERIWQIMLSRGRFFAPGVGFFVAVVLISLFMARAFLRRASRTIARFPEVEIETVRQIWFRKVFLTPRFWKQRFWRGMRRKLDKNPLIWLEYRSTWSRGFRWILLLIIIAINSLAAVKSSFPNDWLQLQLWLGFGLLIVMAFSGSSSFQKERESGAFELLLVAPMRVAELIRGRLTAVWGYYWPALGCIAAFTFLPLLFRLSFGYGSSYNEPRAGLILFSEVLSFITVPIVGFALALKTRHFFTVFIPTLLLAVVWPGAVFDLIEYSHVDPTAFYGSNGYGQVFSLILALQTGLAVSSAWLLHSSLTERRIVTNR